MHESNVVGIKNALESQKSYLIVLRQIRERMEELHYCSPDGGGFMVIRLFSAAWSVFHVPVLQFLLPRCTLDAAVERKVSRALHYGAWRRSIWLDADGTRQRRQKLHFWMRLWNGISKIARGPHLGSSRYGFLFGRCRGV